MTDKKHIIIYSHGFAVRKDDSGLFTDIANNLPEVESLLFDYYQVDEFQNKIFTCSFSEQVKKLKDIINEVKMSNPEAVIDLIGHSQGTIIAAMAKPEGIRKVVLISPVFDNDIDRSINRYKTKPGVKIDLNGISEIPSSTGLTKIIPKEYWQERSLLNLFTEYNSLANKAEVVAIEGNQDELLPKVDLSSLDSRIRVIAIDGDHNFNSPNRNNLIKLIREIVI